MRRSARKKELRAARADARRGVKRGFRELVVGRDTWLWRNHGDKVEIRPPAGRRKAVVPVWQMQGHASEEVWLREHEGCCLEGCCDPCFAYEVTPRMVRRYVDGIRAGA